VRFDLDSTRIEADESVGDSSREHASTVRAEVSRVCDGGVPKA
jgi:hypothetical protein